jgi:methyltransferase (TIGR00027 family)
MKTSRSSKTAEQMALSRAIETRKASQERVCYDPFAERFLSGKYKLPLFARPLRNGVEKLIESLFAGHHYYVIARTRYFDDFLQQQLSGSPEQLVILGAGYDSRAYRFADRLGKVTVFEVDHPVTSATKKLKVQSVLGNVKNCVIYVPVDFNVEKLADKLHQSGYKDRCKTVFLWEGVSPYLSAEAVDEVLQFIVSSGGCGSSVLFDYIVKSLLDGTCDMRGARNEFEKMSRSAEPFTFGIVEGEAPSFLTARGFSDVVDVGAAELKTKYFGEHRNLYIKPWWRMALATVP